MFHRAVLRRLGVPAVCVVVVAGCGVPDESRWERGVGPTSSNTDLSNTDLSNTVTPSDGGSLDVVLVEVGSVEAASEVRGDVRLVDPTVVVADAPGRLERRTTAVGGEVTSADVVLEFSPAPDPADGLRLEILRLEREIALLEGAPSEVERLDAAIDAARPGGASGASSMVSAPFAGTIGQYFVSVFDVVAVGDPLFAVGDRSRRQVVAILDDDLDVALGDDVSIVERRSVLSEPVSATVSDVTDDGVEDGQRMLIVELSAGAPFNVGEQVSVVFESVTEGTSLRLPIDAVRGAGGTPHVLVVDADGAWSRVMVDIGARSDSFAQIIAAEPALVEGDRVVLP
ncbi:MAG: efflux RND transporter periplasmic adaptor subunit [Ilumatobacter sp.]